MSGINKVILIGNLGNDVELKYTASNDAVANLSIATSDGWIDKSGKKQKHTEWHRVILFRKLAEIAGKYLHKGSKVYIDGKIQTKKWQDQNGNDKWTTNIIANNIEMLDGKNASNHIEPKEEGHQEVEFKDDMPF